MQIKAGDAEEEERGIESDFQDMGFPILNKKEVENQKWEMKNGKQGSILNFPFFIF